MNDVGKKKDAGAADDKNPQLNEICRGCGKEVKELSTCLCFCPDSGVALCEVCADGTRKCQVCNHIICSDPNGCSECTELAIFCGYDDCYDLTCDAAICNTDACRKGPGWKHCFCGQVMYCESCSDEGGNNNRSSVFVHCDTCGTLFCNNESGTCGRECGYCMKALCCVCLGIDDPREDRYCPCLEPSF